MDSLYKVGDVVTILDSYLFGSDSRDYMCGFTPEMLKMYGGRKMIIRKVLDKACSNYRSFSVCGHDFKYYLEEDEGGCVWSAEMFKETWKRKNYVRNMVINTNTSIVASGRSSAYTALLYKAFKKGCAHLFEKCLIPSIF